MKPGKNKYRLLVANLPDAFAYHHQDRGRGIAMTCICCEQLFYNDKGNRATVVVKIRGSD